MLFTFKRNEEGLEYIYVGDVRVAKCLPLCTRLDGEYEPIQDVPGVDGELIVEAIEAADESGFWLVSRPASRGDFINNEITVDVPVTDSAVLTVETKGGDEK